MKIPLELNVLDNGEIFINFWDSHEGKDIVVEFVHGLLYEHLPDSYVRHVTFKDFVNQIIETVKEQQERKIKA